MAREERKARKAERRRIKAGQNASGRGFFPDRVLPVIGATAAVVDTQLGGAATALGLTTMLANSQRLRSRAHDKDPRIPEFVPPGRRLRELVGLTETLAGLSHQDWNPIPQVAQVHLPGEIADHKMALLYVAGAGLLGLKNL
ncbi:MAG: hypothetical protein ACRDQZ_21250, partial [Mycobacteriales bacterium]